MRASFPSIMTLDTDEIKYIGLEEITPGEKAALDELSTEYFQKLKYVTKANTTVAIHIKAHEKEGNQRKFSIHAKAECPGHHFESTKAVDWDFRRAVHKAFNDLLRQAENQIGKQREH